MTLSLMFNLFTTLGAVVLLLVSISIFITAYSKNPKALAYKDFFIKNATWFIFVASFIAVAGSLVYSEIFKFEPCALCWWQRVFIYPALFISLVEVFKIWRQKNSATIAPIAKSNIFQYINPLMWFALFFSLYHNYILITQNIGENSLFCDPASLAGACGARFVEVISLIDIPFMALSIILFILVISKLANKTFQK